MNQYARQAILNKTGIDPLAPKMALPKEYALYNKRTGDLIIKGLYKLCKWKKKQEEILNPLTPTQIRLYTQ